MDLQERFKKASLERDNDNVAPAIKEYELIRNEALALGQKEIAADSWHMIGISYAQIKDYPKAEEFFQKAQQEFEEEDNKVRIGAVLRDRAIIATAQNNLQMADQLMQQSIDILSQTQDLNHLGMSKVKMGMIRLKQSDAKKAEKVIKGGIKDLEQVGDNFFHSTAYFNLAEVQKELGKKDEAKKSLDKALEILNQIAPIDEHSRRRQKIKQLSEELDS